MSLCRRNSLAIEDGDIRDCETLGLLYNTAARVKPLVPVRMRYTLVANTNINGYLITGAVAPSVMGQNTDDVQYLIQAVVETPVTPSTTGLLL